MTGTRSIQTTTRGRLPGFRFAPEPRAALDVLPRMDVAAFVGFGASGPVNRPVAIEAVTNFADIFGEDAPLVWDKARGERVRAHLAPTVRAFFRNGGRRCWVVRVAGEDARSNYFPVPGLVRLRPNGTLAPAYARARSRGSWSDALRTSAALLSRPLTLARFASPGDFDLELSSADEIGAGDLLRMTFDAEGYVLMVSVGSAKVIEGNSSPTEAAALRRVVVRIKGREARWFRMPAPPATTQEGDAFIFTSDMKRRRAKAFAPASPEEMWTKDKPVALNLALPTHSAPPPPGTLVRVDFADEQLWLMVASANVVEGVSLPTEAGVQVKGEALYWLKGATPSPLPSSEPFVECLQFELSVRRGDTDPVRLTDLGFAPEHARFWGALPTDEEFFADTQTPFESRRSAERAARADFGTKYETLWRSVAAPRFALAGRHKLEARDIYFPLAMPALPESYLRPVKLRQTKLERDGLARFDDRLFLDSQLRDTDTETLMSQADFIRYGSPQPRALTGIHAALAIEEATIISVPDEVHTGWELMTEERVEASASKPVPHPEWWRSLACNPPPSSLPEATEPPRDHFLDCDLKVVAKPTLTSDEPDPSGTFTLNWESEDEEEVGYVLEEATSPGWEESAVIYTGKRTDITLYGRSAGDYFYRVRATLGPSSSEWSDGAVVRVSVPGEWRMKRVKQYSASTLLNVHRALLRMCAARGDMFAILSLPEHYRESEATAHASALRMQTRPALPGERPAGQIPPLSYAERRALTYGALYHPWLVGREENALSELRFAPPAGAVSGSFALRANTRGAWIAPANEPLRGVVALAPQMLRYRLLDLQTAQVNIVRQEPRGFLLLDADTLSDDPDLRSIGVRRLMILLRRLALRLGATYVFEPNDDSFRRLVERGFEEMLEDMFTRGAFAGQTPSTSYRVDAGSPPNTPQSVDQGRFIVELRVAPSEPLSFMTIRLLQTTERDVAVEER